MAAVRQKAGATSEPSPPPPAEEDAGEGKREMARWLSLCDYCTPRRGSSFHIDLSDVLRL